MIEELIGLFAILVLFMLAAKLLGLTSKRSKSNNYYQPNHSSSANKPSGTILSHNYNPSSIDELKARSQEGRLDNSPDFSLADQNNNYGEVNNIQNENTDNQANFTPPVETRNLQAEYVQSISDASNLDAIDNKVVKPFDSFVLLDDEDAAFLSSLGLVDEATLALADEQNIIAQMSDYPEEKKSLVKHWIKQAQLYSSGREDALASYRLEL